MNHSHCTRCGRKITATKSITDGMGRTCKAKVAKAAKTPTLTDRFKPFQVNKAVELIEQGGVARGRRFYLTVNSKGTGTYLTSPRGCSCPAGAKGLGCYHVLAVRILTNA